MESNEFKRNQELNKSSKSKTKGSRRQLFDAGQDSSRESTVTPQDKPGSFRPALLPTPGSTPRSSGSTPRPAPGSTPRPVLGSTPKPTHISASKPKLASTPGIYNSNNSNKISNSSAPSLLPPNFCPKAWSTFRLDESALISALFNTQLKGPHTVGKPQVR